MKIRIFTDGACSGNPGPGGWGAVILFSDERQEIAGFEPDTTNNRMELTAVVEALKLTLRLGYSDISIYSDSAYVVNAVLCGWIQRWKNNDWKTARNEEVKNKDLWKELTRLLSKSQYIRFVKVKGHSGVKYNERADELATKQIEVETRRKRK